MWTYNANDILILILKEIIRKHVFAFFQEILNGILDVYYLRKGKNEIYFGLL